MTRTIYRFALPLWAAMLCTTLLIAASADGQLTLLHTAVALA